MAALLLVLGSVAVLLYVGSSAMQISDALPGAALIEAVGIGGLAAGWVGAVGGIALWILCFLDGDTLIAMRTPVGTNRHR